MKPKTFLLFATALGLQSASQLSYAASIQKADNTTNLNLAGSWTGGVVPGVNDVAQWTSTVTGANSTVLGADQSWQGISVAGPGGAVTIGAGNTLTLGTGGIDMSAATQNLTISSNFVTGAGNKTWNVATGRTLTFNTGTFTRAAGASLLVDKSANTGTVAASPALINTVVPWGLTLSAGTVGNNLAAGYNFATVTSGNVVAYTAATAVTTGYPATSATTNYDWSSTGTQGQIGSSRAFNTIRFTGTAAVTQLTNSAQTETGNAIINAGGGAINLGGGTFAMNYQPSTATNELVLGAMTSGIVMNGPIINNGANAAVVTVIGAGANAVTLAGANTFTGGVNANSGTVLAGVAAGLGTGSLRLNGGAFATSATGLTITNAIVAAAGTTSTLGQTNNIAATTLSGAWTGSGTVVNYNTGTTNTGANIFITGNLSGFTGTIQYTGSGANSSPFFRVGATAGATVDMSAGTLNLQTGDGGTAKLFGFIDGTTVANTLKLSQLTGNGRFQGSFNGTAGVFNTVEVGNGNASSTFSGIIGLANNNMNQLALTKVGSGTLTLTGANVYTGATTISSGTLQLGDGTTDGTIATTSGISGTGTLAVNRVNNNTATYPISGGVTVTKSGAATQTFTGANSYTGATTVNAGGVAYSTSAQSLGSSAFTLADNTSLGVKAAAAGSTLLTTGNLSVGTSGPTTLNFDFNSLNTTAPLISSAALTANGTVNVNLSNAAFLGNGDHVLIDYTSYSGSGVFPSGTFTLGARSTGTIVNDVANTVLKLTVANDTAKWTGLDSSIWVANSTGANGNWRLVTGNTATDYIDGDLTLFDDTASNYFVDISAPISPAGITFNNSNAAGKAYTLTSLSFGGAIQGSSTLTKNGTGSLTMVDLPNTYTGGTNFNGGTLNLNSAGIIGTSLFTIGTGTSKALDNTSGSPVILGNVPQAWNDDFTFTGSNDLGFGASTLTLGGAGTDRTVTVSAGTLTVGELTSTTLGLVKQGTGTLAITSDGIGGLNPGSSLAGTLNVSAGTVQINSSTGTVNGDMTVGGLTGTGTVVNGCATDRWMFVTTTGANTFSGTLANGGTGSLGINKQGAGSLILNGTLNYTGQTTVGGGSLTLNSVSAPTLATVVTGGALTINNTWASTGATTVSGGSMTINAANSGTGTNVTLTNTVALTLGNTQALGAASLVNLSSGTTVGTVTYATDGGDTAYQYSMSSGGTYNYVLDRATAGATVTHNLSTAAAGSGYGSGTLNFTKGANVSGTATASYDKLNLGGGGGGTTTVAPAAGTAVSIGTVTKSNNASAQTLGLGGVTAGNTISGVISNGTGTIALSKSDASTWTLSGANSTYSGGTTINDNTGLLAVTANNALGTGTVTMGNGTTNALARLQLSNNITLGGVTTYNLCGMNQSSLAANARIENLSGANTISGNINFANVGGTYVNLTSTAGTLTLSGNLTATTVTGTRIFNFSGAGNTSVGGVISNGTATIGLVKNDAGTLTLGGVNTYLGTTTISGGTLALTGESPAMTGAVTVAATATFGGNGDVGGNVTIAANAHHALAVATTAAGQNTRNIGGILDLTAAGDILDLTAASAPAAGSYLLVHATGGITGVTAGATLTGTTVNLSGVSGTVAVSPDGKDLVLTVASGSAYDTWKNTPAFTAAGFNNTNNGATQDPDNDGVKNELEFVLGGNPMVSDTTSILPSLDASGSNFVFTFHRADASETEIGLIFQYGTDLAGWTPLAIGATTGTSGAGVNVNEGTPVENPDTITVTVPKGANTKLFGRLKAEK